MEFATAIMSLLLIGLHLDRNKGGLLNYTADMMSRGALLNCATDMMSKGGFLNCIADMMSWRLTRLRQAMMRGGHLGLPQSQETKLF